MGKQDMTSTQNQKYITYMYYNIGTGTGTSNSHRHTHTQPFTALWNLSGTTRVSRYQKKHSPTHTHRGHQSSLSAFRQYAQKIR